MGQAAGHHVLPADQVARLQLRGEGEPVAAVRAEPLRFVVGSACGEEAVEFGLVQGLGFLLGSWPWPVRRRAAARAAGASSAALAASVGGLLLGAPGGGGLRGAGLGDLGVEFAVRVDLGDDFDLAGLDGGEVGADLGGYPFDAGDQADDQGEDDAQAERAGGGEVHRGRDDHDYGEDLHGGAFGVGGHAGGLGDGQHGQHGQVEDAGHDPGEHSGAEGGQVVGLVQVAGGERADEDQVVGAFDDSDSSEHAGHRALGVLGGELLRQGVWVGNAGSSGVDQGARGATQG